MIAYILSISTPRGKSHINYEKMPIQFEIVHCFLNNEQMLNSIQIVRPEGHR